MTGPNLSEYVLVVEGANRAHIRHAFKHSGACTYRTNVASISGELAIPIADLVRKCAEHDAECPWVHAEQWAPFPAADEPFLRPDYIAAPVNSGPITPMRREGGAK